MPTLNLEVADGVTLEHVMKDLAWAAKERERLRVKDTKNREAKRKARAAAASPAAASPAAAGFPGEA